MPDTYTYKVRDRQGRMLEGTLDAESTTLVANRLREMGYVPIQIDKKQTDALKKEIKLFGPRKPKLKDISVFSRQFATMINSGLSLLRALNILTEQTENKELARVLGEVRNDIETGNSLSSAMAKHPDVFPPLMVNMTRAGETGGFLDTTMLQIAQNYEAEVKLRGKVKAAMTYPVVVFVLAVLMCIVMLIFIVPTFAEMFETLGGDLPAPTKVLIFMSDQLKTFFPVLIVLMIAGSITWKKIKHTDRVRDTVDPIKLKLPVFGKLFQKIALSRFARNLGTMMKSGVPILQSLDIVADTTGNVVLGRAVRDVQASVRNGESLCKPLLKHPVFPPMVVQMMAVGEETGALDEMLEKIGEFYEQEVEATVAALTSLLEPALIVVLGGAVGGMVVSLYMPMFNIIKLIK